jgi:hypothetical protein
MAEPSLPLEFDITNVMQHLYDREYKYQRRHKISFANSPPPLSSRCG